MRAAGPVAKHLPDAAFRQVFESFLMRGHDDPEAARQAIAAHWPHYAEHDGAAAFVRQVDALDVSDTLAISDKLSGLNIPTRVVWGAEDQFQKLAYGERLALDLKAPIRRIDEGRHFSPEDHPAIVAQEINALLNDIG